MFIHTTNQLKQRKVTLKSEVAKSQYAGLYVQRTLERDLELSYEFAISFRIPDLWKETLDIDPSYFEGLAKEVSDLVKGKSGYVSTILVNEGVDYCTDETDMYDVPNVIHHKGDRSVSVGSETFGYIPKAWQSKIIVRFHGELSGRMRNSVINTLLGIFDESMTVHMKEDIKRNIERQNPTPGCIDRFSTVFRKDLTSS